MTGLALHDDTLRRRLGRRNILRIFYVSSCIAHARDECLDIVREARYSFVP